MYKVVLVDDEQFILGGLKQMVPWNKYGCQVVATANDGLEGVQIIRREQPDMLFTDIRMPNMDGLQMVAALKSEFPNMQISVLTAFRDFEFAQTAIRLGVTRYLLKPSKMNELEEAVAVMAERLDALKGTPEVEPPVEAAANDESSGFIVQAAMKYIQAHYTENIRLSDVADNTYVSQWHLSKLINRETGQSFFDIINSLRIDHAKTLLREPTLKVHEIADLVGFSDVAHFSKTFKRITGVTPVDFRNGRK